MRVLIAFLVMAFAPACMAAQAVPKNAEQYLPVLRGIQVEKWPDAPIPSFLGAQVEKESCVTLKSARCWSPKAQLKTSREYGFGLGQITIAYNRDGSVRFNNFEALKKQRADLSGWTWDNRFDARYQLLALVDMDHGIYGRQRAAATDIDRLAFTLSAYNGGEGGVLQDRRLCGNTDGCDSARWFGNVEHTSLKAKRAVPGYGQSFFAVNRGYVHEIIFDRRPKYEPYFSDAQ